MPEAHPNSGGYGCARYPAALVSTHGRPGPVKAHRVGSRTSRFQERPNSIPRGPYRPDRRARDLRYLAPPAWEEEIADRSLHRPSALDAHLREVSSSSGARFDRRRPLQLRKSFAPANRVEISLPVVLVTLSGNEPWQLTCDIPERAQRHQGRLRRRSSCKASCKTPRQGKHEMTDDLPCSAT